jgi:hypothetical protein
VLGIWLLRRRSTVAVAVLWLFVIETAVDLVNGTVIGIRHHATASAHDLTWVILNFYVPVLWATLVLAAWQLATRRTELAGGANPESTRAAEVRGRSER